MSRIHTVRNAAAVLAILSGVALLTAAPAQPPEAPKKASRTLRGTREKLTKEVSIPNIEPNTPLKEVLEFLSDRFQLTMLLENEAFQNVLQVQEPENQPVKLSKMNDIPLETILRRVCAQVQAGFYVDHSGIIHLVPAQIAKASQLKQLVSSNFEKKPLNEALKSLVEYGGYSVVLDEKRAGDKARTLVTAELSDVSYEAAVTILADLAELKVVPIDNVLYVTTPQNAQVLLQEQRKKKQEEAELPGFGPPPAGN